MSPKPDDRSDDLSTLAWVHEELRRSLEAAHKALRRFVKEAEALGGSDIDAVDPAVLRMARSQIHQGVGALELVGQSAAAMVLRASEALVQRFVSKPHKLTSKIVDDIERASFALLDYLTRLLANKPVSALSLFPQYRAIQEAAGADRVHPADLWAVDWQWRDLPGDPSAAPRVHDDSTHSAIEAQLLPLMRAADPLAAARMSDLCAGLGAGATQPQIATLWKLASAVFDAQAHGLLISDVFSKRMTSRLLAQYRILERGEFEVSERLAQDLLFFCAQSASPGDGRKAPRLAAVRRTYGLVHQLPADYSVSVLGRFDPAVIAQARKRVAAAKDAWSAVAGGEMHRMTGLSEQFALVGESLKRLFPLGETFATELQQAVVQTQQGGSAPPAPLAMEVATSLLYVEAALEDADFDNPAQATRVRRLAERLSAVRKGRASDPLEGWMEELYRRVSDRQTMGSVVQELRASLSEAEKLIDQYFRSPEQRQVLIPVPNQLASMRGVLSVLGMDQASAALLRMRDEVDALASTEVDPQHVGQTAVFDRLAGNLGALGFLIDMLSVQPQLAKSLFTYDAAAGTLSPVMGRSEVMASSRTPGTQAPVEQRLLEQAQMLAFTSVREDVSVADVSRDLERLSHEAQAADEPALSAAVLKAQQALGQAEDSGRQATVRGELSEALVDFVSTRSTPVGLDPQTPTAAGRLSRPMTLDFAPSTTAGKLAHDDEMREIFLEEAREVLATAKSARADLARTPDDLSLLTTLRRAFHTLKGSSRMVGLKDFGEAAWACEQIYNTQLADQTVAAEALLGFTEWSLGYLAGWVEDIAARRRGSHDPATVIKAAKRVSAGQLSAVPSPAVAAPLAFGLPLDLPSGADLDLRAIALPAGPEPVFSFELNLAELDAANAAANHAIASDHTSLDITTPTLADPFDSAPTERLPIGDTIEEPAVAAPTDLLIVDLELDIADDAAALRAAEPIAVPVATKAQSAPKSPGAGLDSAAPAHKGPAAGTLPTAALAAPPVEQRAFDEDHVKVVGPLRIGIPLFNIYLNEADVLSRRLAIEVAEWGMELHRPIGETPISLAHSLAGSSATVGFADLSQLARLLEHAQARSLAIGRGTPEEARLFVDAAEEIRRLLHQFAAGFLSEPSPELMARLADHELSSSRRLEAAVAAADLPTGAERRASARQPGVPERDDAVAERSALPSPVGAAALPAQPRKAAADETTFGTAAAARQRPSIDVSPRAAPDAVFGRDETRFDALGVAEFRPFGDVPVEAPRAGPSNHSLVDADDVIDAVDAIDAELFPIFEEEAEELMPQLAGHLRDWVRKPGESAHPAACMRTLHTLKGGARLSGAMRLGEMAHHLESRIELVLASPPIAAADVEALQTHGDALFHAFDSLRSGETQADAAPAGRNNAALQPARVELPTAPELGLPLEVTPSNSGLVPVASMDAVSPSAPLEAAEPAAGPASQAATQQYLPEMATRVAAAAPAVTAVTEPSAASQVTEQAKGHDATAGTEPAAALHEIDWTRFSLTRATERRATDRGQGAQSSVRVRAPLLDRLVNQAGEVSITRSRIESGVGTIKTSLTDLTENLERLRAQLRDIEFQAETQMSSRLEAAKAASQTFDPLEFDRFTRFQEITRMMAESVNDVATVQRTLKRSLETTEDELVAQARMTRDLQDDLLRTRMVAFEGLSDRLYRVVRLAAKETGKSVRLDIVGGSIEIDRGVLDRMTGSFEHLLRNCVSHGIEMAEARTRAGKDSTGTIIVALSHEGNEVGVEFRDDGAGLDLARIRAKGIALGLLDANAQPTDAALSNLIFAPGFSTADVVTELSGRGVGMDVVRADVNAIGGRIETATAVGQGTSFKLILPLTTAVTQVVMLRCGDTQVAVPSTLVEVVRRAAIVEIDEAYASGTYTVGDRALQFFWLGALLQISPRPGESTARMRTIVVIRSAQQRIVVHVDEVLGNQEVVVKNLGPQLSRLPGLAGITLLASGAVALIYNPVALATLYGDAARAATRAALQSPEASAAIPVESEPAVPEAPLVMVVDDSLTVRRVTQRMLLREGYRVVLAKDGMDALERLAETVPQIVLSDIEMPRMDGFDLVRNMRADARLRDLPVIMITSRIAQKHRDYAAELGVDHYLGKPYSEEDLLALIAGYTKSRIPA